MYVVQSTMISFLKFLNFKPNSKAFNNSNRKTLNSYSNPEAVDIFHHSSKQNGYNASVSKIITDGNNTTPKNVAVVKRKLIETIDNFGVKKTTRQEDVNKYGRARRSLKSWNMGIAGQVLRNNGSPLVCRPWYACSFHTAAASNGSAQRSLLQQDGSRNQDGRAEPAVLSELVEGLSARSAYISPKYLYDPLGSKLFETICSVPEYYPTRTEAAIVNRYAEEIAAAVGSGVTLIDLGAGNCAKAVRLIPLLKPQQYVPVDISAEFLEDAARGLRFTFPALDVRAVAADFSSALQLPVSVRSDRRLFFYPGSSIGNFSADESLQFLRGLRLQLANGSGALLLGIDLVKDAAVLEAAYDDALGVTAAFNRNVLLHVNRLLGADFDVAHWRHRGTYNPVAQRMEMCLEAKRDVVVTWSGGGQHGARQFGQGERIHTENSHKYTTDSVRALLDRAGFATANVWFDSRKWFMICHAEPV